MYTSGNCQNDGYISCPYGAVDGACRNVDIDATPVSVALGSLEITTWGWRKLRATSTTSMTHPRVTVHPFTGGRTTQWVTIDTFSSKTISVTIGTNDGPQKTVAPSSSIMNSGNGANFVIQCPNIITKNERTNSDYKNANDKFSVSVSSTNQLTVTRTDKTKAWSMNLQFECIVKSEGLINLGEKYIFDSSTKEIIVDFPPGDDSTLSISTSVNMKYRRWWHGHNTNKIAMIAGLNNKVRREFSYIPKLDVIRWSEDKEELIKKNIYYEMRRIQNGPTSSEYLQCSLNYCNKYIALRMNLCGNRLCRTRLESVACHNHWVNIGSKENPSRQPNVYDCQQSTVKTSSCATETNNGESGKIMLQACKNKFTYDSVGLVGSTTDVDYAGCNKCFDEWTTLYAASVWAPGGVNRLQTKDINMPTCSKCDAGQYQDSTTHGKFGCKVCNPGKISSAGREACQSCLIGTYMDEWGGGLCKTCVPGKIASAIGAVSCVDCELGTYSPTILPELEKRNQCKKCGTGSFNEFTGSVVCKLCPKGSYGNKEKAVCQSDGCSDCSIGQKQPEKGQATCIPCLAGFSQATTGKQICDLCEAGKTTLEIKQASCTECLALTYLSESMRGIESKCSPCAGATKGATECGGCPLGKAGTCSKSCASSTNCKSKINLFLDPNSSAAIDTY